ncbi:MAG TPA: iron donor protein CyaY [Vineibacter sp.]|nr:iron donor protein CyaY [Vineibacter sp.]
MTANFDVTATRLLDRFADRLEAALADVAEVDYEGGILNVTLESGGTYVINKHAPTQQVWLSSPQSGAWHFSQDATSGAWRDTRQGRDLLELLAGELAAATGVAVTLD